GDGLLVDIISIMRRSAAKTPRTAAKTPKTPNRKLLQGSVWRAFWRLLGPEARGLVGVLAGEPVDLGRRQAAAGLDDDRGRLAAGLLLRPDVQDAVGVHAERDVDAHVAGGTARDVAEHEPAEQPVLRRDLGLPL